MTGSAHIDRLPAPHLLPEFRFDLAQLRYPERLNAAVALIDGGDPDAPAVVNDAGVWTYAGMRDRSDRIAAVLAEEGLVPGNRVLLRGPNDATLFACWLGVLKAGGIAVTTMPMLRAPELGPIIRRAEVSHALVDAHASPSWRRRSPQPISCARCSLTRATGAAARWSGAWRPPRPLEPWTLAPTTPR